jgi:hypothetical protein
MKNPNQKNSILTSTLAVLAAGALALGFSAQATNFAGNGSTDWGGHVGTGTLTLTDDGTNITFTITPTGGDFGGNMVALYIDTSAGGFSSTSGFNDANDGGRSAVSGYSGSGQSVMTFASGFRPSYAIAFGNTTSDFTSLFQLVNGGGGSLNWITGTGTSTHTLVVSASQIGLTNGHTATIRVFGSLISSSGYRSLEAIAGDDTTAFVSGYNPFTQTSYSTYTFAPAVVVTYPVTFNVDMTAQIINGSFDPNNGDTVFAHGSFESTPWAGFQLSASGGNTNIYTGTYSDANTLGTMEQFKFQFHHVATPSDSWDSDPNRYFTLQSGGQNLPLVYFNNVPAVPSATTNATIFSIDMGPQVYLGHFDPNAGDQIQVLGSYQNPQWTAPGLILTNNPSSATSNIYSGTLVDNNYPGTEYNYKFVIVNGANNNYESTGDRKLVTPTNSGTLPLAFFNGVSNIYSTPITFSVDMTVPIVSGTFTPGSGDTVSAAGTFQTNTWSPGSFVLTNNSGGANPNIFTGTYLDRNQPGAGESYKFVVISGGGANTNWENNNRTFLLGSTAQSLPTVFWNNLNTNQVVLAATTLNFTVDMTGAVDSFGYPFVSGSDAVVINGDFLNPQWPNIWTDATLYYPPFGNDYGPGNGSNPVLVLQDSGDGYHFTGSFTIPAGQTHKITYKYGIYHSNGSQFNTNCDNEGVFGQNHERYIRNSGTYNLPTDIFGAPRVGKYAAGAGEPLYGIALGSPMPGHLPINWLGFPGVHLQTCTNLVTPVWQDLSGTDGAGTNNWPTISGGQFFRLWPTPQ